MSRRPPTSVRPPRRTAGTRRPIPALLAALALLATAAATPAAAAAPSAASAPAGGPVRTAPAAASEPLQWTLTRAGTTFADPGAPGGSQAHLWSDGTAATTVSGEGQVVVHARADQCDGGPVMSVIVDGRAVGWLEVRSAVRDGWRAYAVGDFELGPGEHEVVVAFERDHSTGSCDRNLHLGGVDLVPASVLGDGLRWSLRGSGVVLVDGTAPGGTVAHLWANATASVRASGGGTLAVLARSDVCEYPARMEVLVDGRFLGTATVPNVAGWWHYPLGAPQPAGEHHVTVRYLNDMSSERCDRNLRVGGVSFSGGGGAASAAPIR